IHDEMGMKENGEIERDKKEEQEQEKKDDYGVGGYGSYLLGLNKKTYELAGGASSSGTYKELGVGSMMGYSFLACFIGLFVLIPLRKVLIVDYKLIFPSGMATDWFFTGKEGDCGFAQFPTFGLKAWKNTFYFDFSMTYVGTGMIFPHIVNLSLLFGVVSWGIMWPLIRTKKGDWFPTGLPESSIKSLNSYKAFISIALILGGGLYNFIKILCITFMSVHGRFKTKNLDLVIEKKVSEEEQKMNENFIRETIVAYIFAPSLAFCNAYGAGLTDFNMAYNYGKIGLFMMAALAGKDDGVVAGMAVDFDFSSTKTFINNQSWKRGSISSSVSCSLPIPYS
ncbi:hypothetical protein M8C21_000133, partial [Ambrosia artemisiifolia]